MRIIDLRDDNNELIGFQVSNVLISRKQVERIVRRIPGATISRPVRRLFSSEPAKDEFCVFQVGETDFVAEEPFGDNSKYLVVARLPMQSSELDLVREAFRNWRPLLALSALIRIAVLLLAFAAIVRFVIQY